MEEKRRALPTTLDLARVHERLVAAHQELDDPRYAAEGLEGASCGPHVKHLAQLAAAAAAEGLTAEQWRGWIRVGVGAHTIPLLERAETCMRGAGLWPWHD